VGALMDRRVLSLAGCLALARCEPPAPIDQGPDQAPPSVAASAPTPAPPPSPAEPSPQPPAPTTPFDPNTVTHATVRIVAVPARQHWFACGVVHSVGAIEVEVLDAGEPAPRMMLFVSCPVDFGHRGLLREGEVLTVRLHARKQSWPRPPVEVPAGMVVRYVAKLSPRAEEAAGR